MESLSLPPIAGPFVESLRSIGYSLESAVADVIDNSMSANSSHVEVLTSWCNGSPFLMVADNGTGMNKNELKSAMQLGAVGPSMKRDKSDLGRFGMGLKTASFSQCKKLTVISRKSPSDPWQGLCWDLEIVEKENEWLAQILSNENCEELISQNSYPFEKGTAVLWNCFDKIIDVTAPNGEKDYERSISNLKEHLALTFHRFLAGDRVAKKVNLKLNGKVVEGKDPFALFPPTGCASSTLLTDETIRLGEHNIVVKAFQIPHPSQMTHSFMEKISKNGNLHADQGLYIYRAGRLIAAGGWMKLAKASEANKLARIEVEFENSSDDIWKIDVKKSKVQLPSSLREQLRRVISVCSSKSSATFTKRAKMKSLDKTPIWDRYFDREKERVVYKLNKNHPAILKVFSGISKEDSTSLINLLEQTLPLELIKNDISATNVRLGYADSELEDSVRTLVSDLHASGFDIEIVRETLLGDGNIRLGKAVIDKIINETWG